MSFIGGYKMKIENRVVNKTLMNNHPCVKECPFRSTYCKLTCDNFITYEQEQIKVRAEKDRQWELQRGYYDYRHQQKIKALKRWMAKVR